MEEHRRKCEARYGTMGMGVERPLLTAFGGAGPAHPVLLSPYFLRIDHEGPKFEALLQTTTDSADATLLIDPSDDAAMSVTTQQVMRDQIRNAQNDENMPREWANFHSASKREVLAQHVMDYLAQVTLGQRGRGFGGGQGCVRTADNHRSPPPPPPLDPDFTVGLMETTFIGGSLCLPK